MWTNLITTLRNIDIDPTAVKTSNLRSSILMCCNLSRRQPSKLPCCLGCRISRRLLTSLWQEVSSGPGGTYSHTYLTLLRGWVCDILSYELRDWGSIPVPRHWDRLRAHPASYRIVPLTLLQGDAAAPPPSAEVKNTWSYSSIPHRSSWARCTGSA
jgi:hypothetical protein